MKVNGWIVNEKGRDVEIKDGKDKNGIRYIFDPENKRVVFRMKETKPGERDDFVTGEFTFHKEKWSTSKDNIKNKKNWLGPAPSKPAELGPISDAIKNFKRK